MANQASEGLEEDLPEAGGYVDSLLWQLAVPEVGAPMVRQCCNSGCMAKHGSGTRLAELRENVQKMPPSEQDDFLWDLVRASRPSESRPHWILLGEPVCRAAWKSLVGIGSTKLNKFLAALGAGHLRPFEDQRKHNGKNKVGEKYLDADGFFNFLYHYVAEPLAEEDLTAPEVGLDEEGTEESSDRQAQLLEWTVGKDTGNVATMSAMVALTGGVGERRWLPHMTSQELYEMYLFHGVAGERKARRTTFFSCYRDQGWTRLLKIRDVAQHARCETCARLAKATKCHPSALERLAAEKALRVHRQRNFADRAVDARLSTLSLVSTDRDGETKESRVLHIRIDGMDQAKFRCPRNLENSKGWASLWRPTLHCVGVLVEGVLEAYFVTDQDVKKDSNLELSALAYALDLTRKELDMRGVSMPEHLSLTYDNTAREGKNQHVAKWMGWLVLHKKFRSVQDGNGQVGHTHNKQDQRFSVVAACLKRQKLLQTPEDFLTVIQQHVHPTGNRKLVVGKIEGAWDWQEFFEPWDMNVTGIAASHWRPDVCHSKRFVTRRDLPQSVNQVVLSDWALVVPPIFKDAVEDPNDVIMLTKEFWSSEALSHPPTLFLPVAWADKTLRVPGAICRRNKMSQDQLREFRRTAAKIKEDPWCLTSASAYLSKWCDQNAQGCSWNPPSREFLLDDQQNQRWERAERSLADRTQDDDWLRYAPGVPEQITLHPGARKRSLTGGLAGVDCTMKKKGTAKAKGKAKAKAKGKGKGNAEDEEMDPGDSGVLPPAEAPPPVPRLPDPAPLPLAGAEPPPPVPLPSPRGPEHAAGLEPARGLGCTKCRNARAGCQQCRKPGYRPRGPKRQPVDREGAGR